MRQPSPEELDRMWHEHATRWRDPAQALSVWDGSPPNAALLSTRATGRWWDVLDRLQITLLVTREYEHLLLAATVDAGRPSLSHLPLPHPSGLAVDRTNRTVAVACTRNPNQIFELSPITNPIPRADVRPPQMSQRPLLPIRSMLYPGALYIHDLAYIAGELYANSVGQNAVVALDGAATHRLVWWPRCVEQRGRPVI
ncbi:MAG: DUF4915 domain-containing protein, partial [Sciscionella sp.]